MNISPFKAIYPNLDFITESESFLETVKPEYLELKNNGFFDDHKEEALYITKIITEKRTYTGFIAAVNINDYINGHIKKHEATLSAKEQVHVSLVLKNKAFLKPVLLTYPSNTELHNILEKITSNSEPFLTLEQDIHGQDHLIWMVSDKNEIANIVKLFHDLVPDSYIADGHHRTSTTSLLYNRLAGKKDQNNYEWLLAGFFPSDELEIDEFNRVVEALNDMTISSFFAQLSAVCDIKAVKKGVTPAAAHEMIMYINKEWYSIKWRPEILKKYKNEPVILDVVLLNNEILQNIIGIIDVRTDQRVRYVEGPLGIQGVKDLVVRDRNCIGFCMYPIELEDFMRIADAGQILPPKSTWFQPRLRNGLIIMDH